MALSDQDRILNERLHPRIVDLWFALQSLRSVVSFMNTGAHPDDETSAMLAALGFRDGLSLSFACANRGEGGQNDIGTEAGADLGALRTREMERAAEVLNMRLYWLSETPDDTIFDFGFSKSGAETLAKWGHARTLKRFVEIVRTERPDIICPTFLDVPGQHGHHRAMTQAALEVMALAADPAFDCALAPWQVKKLYLPAWGGGGGSYDDEMPPPPETLRIAAKGSDPVTGWSFEHIGQQSRAYHKTQGMGRWWPLGEERDWPLHLAQSHVSGPDNTIFSGLARDLRDLGLGDAQDAVDAAIEAFPDTDGVAKAAARAIDLLSAVKTRPDHHRITRKIRELSRVIYLAGDERVTGRFDRTVLRQSETVAMHLTDTEVGLSLPDGWGVTQGAVNLSKAEISDPYRANFDPVWPPAPAIGLGRAGVETRLAFEEEPLVLPKSSAQLAPEKAVLNKRHETRQISVVLSDLSPFGADARLDLPKGWSVSGSPSTFEITAPEDLEEGLLRIPLLLDGAAAQTVRVIDYPHINPTARISPAELTLRVIDVKVPKARVGYIGAGNDRVDHWLGAIGADVTVLADGDLTRGGLSGYDTLIVGIFAMRFRAGLAEAMPAIKEWVQEGGNLITLYHRPWDNWDPQTTPPKPLEIGQPSLRWRVTDEHAEVTHLVPDHQILNMPNPIGPEDWNGWHKERGLYFAKSWDAAYQPLLEMADPGERPHHGAFLAGRIGKGQHIHTSLILHHQMEHLTPGAFRLFANMIASVR